MKKIVNILTLALVLGLTSCVQDLNTEPIDPNVLQTFNQDEVYYKIYAGLGTSGQKGPDGNCDIVANDEGYSVFYRLLFVHNEFPTDCGWWIWEDAGITDINETKWTSENSFTKLLYNRLTFNVTVCNHFLENTEGKTDDKTIRQRAEIRFMRVLNYYYLMDFFGNPPFALSITTDNPKQIEGGRKALYEWCVEQLLDAENNLEEKTTLYRANKNAARLLLARLYLNAEVYTNGEVKAYDKAAEYAKLVMGGSYELTENYAEMFMGDNNNNKGTKEIIFAIPQDGDYIQSWGASSCMVCMTRAEGMLSWGSTDKWECFRSSPSLVKVFAGDADPATIEADEYAMPALLGDDRAMLCNQAKADPVDPTLVTWQAECSGPAEYGTGNFSKCWAICKWSGLTSEGKMGKHTQFVDTDVPFLRVAEAYLTYAEAKYRMGETAEALSTVNTLRATRHAATLSSVDDKTLLDEWLREFYAEGRRRVDLIRFGQFAGPNATMTWEGHKAKKDAKYNVYAIPNSDCVANPNLKQNEGF